MIHMARFPKTSILLEKTLYKKGLAADMEDLILLGCVYSAAGGKNKVVDPQMLYMLTVPQPNKESLNIVQERD